jgi:Tol biopolymer transport system component
MRRRLILAVVVAAALAASVLALALSEGSSIKRSLVYEAGGSIWRANLDGSHPVRLASGTNPQISPDGRLVASTRVSPASGIFVIPAGGGKAEVIKGLAAGNLNLVWAPNSRLLAVGADDGLHVVDVRSGAQKFIAKASIAYSSVFSPDSRSLVYELPERNGSSDLHVVNLESDKTRRLTRLGDATLAVWGPKEIAFSSNGEIWLIEGNGKQLRQLGQGLIVGASYGAPAGLSADGKLLLAVAPIQTAMGPTLPGGFKAIAVPSGKVRFSGAKGDLLLGLSRDGQVALASSCVYTFLGNRVSGGGIETISLDGDRPRMLVRGACFASWNA